MKEYKGVFKLGNRKEWISITADSFLQAFFLLVAEAIKREVPYYHLTIYCGSESISVNPIGVTELFSEKQINPI